jgi:hypothetical protein
MGSIRAASTALASTPTNRNTPPPSTVPHQQLPAPTAAPVADDAVARPNVRLSTSMTTMTAVIARYPAPVSIYQPPAPPPSTPFIPLPISPFYVLYYILIVYIVLLLLIYILMTVNSCKPAGTRHGYGYGYTRGPKMATRQGTRTRTTGYGFSRVRVRVQPKVPAGYPRCSLL